MAMTRYEPWSVFQQLTDELSRVMDQRPARYTDDAGNVVASDWVPAVDIREEADNFVIYADIPGVDPADIDVHMENGTLSISGERSKITKEEHDGYKRTERVRGNFLRRFSLPDSADAERIAAKCRNGVLEVVIPKHEKLQPRKISVSE